MNRIRVLIADDHALFRGGIARVLADRDDLEVVAEASNGREAVDRALELSPDVVIMDLAMPEMGGLEATAELQHKLPQAKVLILTISDQQADLFAALESGARGYILKEVRPQELVEAVLQIAQGWVLVSPSLATKLLAELRLPTQSPPLAVLTEREQEVLRLVVRGLSNQEIADFLTISVNTVKTHLRNILDKLHLKSRSQAAVYGAESGLLRPNEDQPTKS